MITRYLVSTVFTKRFFVLTLSLLAASFTTVQHAAKAQPDTALERIEKVERVAWVTGKQSINNTLEKYDIDGTDLGVMFAQGDMLYIAFGDTFSCCRPPEGGGGGLNWRSNTLAFTKDRNLNDGITFDGMLMDDYGQARQFLDHEMEDVTVIPTAGIAIGKRLYLHYMAVGLWGDPGKWTLTRSGWGYSDDGGKTWTQPMDSTWKGDTAFGQAAVVESDGYVYVYGIHGGRFGGVSLARIRPNDVLSMDKYEYWDGKAWSTKLADVVEIVPAPVGELSVAWNNYLERWIMTYLDESQRAIVIREAPELTGPWSDTKVVVSDNEYPGLYGAFLHPWASDGETIYFNMSQWVPYNVMLMRAQLVKRG